MKIEMVKNHMEKFRTIYFRGDFRNMDESEIADEISKKYHISKWDAHCVKCNDDLVIVVLMGHLRF